MFFTVPISERNEWEHLVSGVPHEVFHTWSYAKVCSFWEETTPLLACAQVGDDLLFAPLVIRGIPGDSEFLDATSPYGQTGPICSSTDLNIQSVLVDEWITGLKGLGIVSLFLRLNPYVGVAQDAFVGFGDVVSWGRQVYVDTQEVFEQGLSPFRQGCRYDIRTLQKSGWAVRVDDPQDKKRFPKLYRETMRRLESSSFYLFSDDAFSEMYARLDTILVAAVSPEGEVGAMALYIGELGNPYGQYFLSASDRRVSNGSPSKLALYSLILQAHGKGVAILNLGGGRGGKEDSLFRFKTGFSKRTLPLLTANLILDQQRYNQLSYGHKTGEFFPRYRF